MDKENSSVADTTLESNDQLDVSIYSRSDLTMRVATPEPEVTAAVNSNSGSTGVHPLNS